MLKVWLRASISEPDLHGNLSSSPAWLGEPRKLCGFSCHSFFIHKMDEHCSCLLGSWQLRELKQLQHTEWNPTHMLIVSQLHHLCSMWPCQGLTRKLSGQILAFETLANACLNHFLCFPYTNLHGGCLFPSN